ncbi:hypothetical protein Scep_002289 [Stephania cephalantha]|uniref:Uncharacterized protein n=1 Tax=Stephania cephalantha TaxID=152367 RepID=A0AAP0L9Q9_9MAGN
MSRASSRFMPRRPYGGYGGGSSATPPFSYHFGTSNRGPSWDSGDDDDAPALLPAEATKRGLSSPPNIRLPIGARRPRDPCRDVFTGDVPIDGHGGGSSATPPLSYSLPGPLIEASSWDSGGDIAFLRSSGGGDATVHLRLRRDGAASKLGFSFLLYKSNHM